MKLLENMVWLLLGGLVFSLIYVLGLLLCLTIIGIPLGIQLFKLGTFFLWPFGPKTAGMRHSGSAGSLSAVINFACILLGWGEIALIVWLIVG